MDFNVENAREAIRMLKELPDEKFDMDFFFYNIGSRLDPTAPLPRMAGSIHEAVALWDAHTCNTAMCLAGLIQFHKAVTTEEKKQSASRFAGEWLGLEDSDYLFMPSSYDIDEYDEGPVTREQVINRLKQMIADEEE